MPDPAASLLQNLPGIAESNLGSVAALVCAEEGMLRRVFLQRKFCEDAFLSCALKCIQVHLVYFFDMCMLYMLFSKGKIFVYSSLFVCV